MVFGIRGFPWIGGGAERHSEALYPLLVERGHDVTILTRQLTMETWKGVKFVKLPYINNQYFEALSHSILATIYCIRHRPDLVHIHNIASCPIAFLFPLFGIRNVLTIHSLNYLQPKWGKVARFVLNYCEMVGINFSEEIVSVSREIVKYLKAKYKRDIPISFIANGVAEPEFVKPNLLLKKIGVEPKKYILSVGRLSEEKGLENLIMAYKNIQKPDYKLVIVGGYTHNTLWVRNLMAQKGENIKFTGFICGKDLAELYTNAGLFVAPSPCEGFPLVMLEALSYGLPVLASDIFPHREMKLESKRYCNCENIKEFSLKMDKLIGEGITEEEAEKYRTMLKGNYDWKAIAYATHRKYI